jgi:mRNA-degrading endonuclease RelE of RelBE toxin-antitoxin system
MMQGNFTIYYSEEARLDLLEAVKWYNSINIILDKRLKKEIKNVEKSIKLNPAFASIKYRNVRTVACKIFPYSIHYEVDVDQNRILIISIFHFSKEPLW